MVGVILALLFGLQLKSRIRLQVAVEAAQSARIGEAHGQRVLRAGTVEGRSHGIEVTPNLALKRAAIGGEDAHHFKLSPHQADLRAQIHASHALLSPLAHNDFVESWPEAAPLHNGDAISHGKRLIRHGADSGVGECATLAPRQSDNRHEFRRGERAAVGGASDTRIDRNLAGLLARKRRGELRRRTLLNHNGILLGAGGAQCRLKAAGHREQRHKHNHDQTDATNG